MKLGEKILKLRKKEGLSQEELGEKINVTRQTISNWELGETSPNPEQLKLLSKELHISLDELLDNDIQNVLIEKVSNTEKLSGTVLKLLKIMLFVIIGIIVLWFILIIGRIIVKNTKDYGRDIEETIHCRLYGEEHSFSITYHELTGEAFALGGDTYFSNILDLDKYDDAHQIFDVVNDYVKKNGGTCEIIPDTDLNDIVNIYVKDGTLTKTGATFVIETNTDYNISYGEEFWLEKYDSKTHNFEVLKGSTGNTCAFNMIAYNLVKNTPREIKQDFSCEYGELTKGLYRLVKHVSFNSDRPIDEDSIFYIWAEFSID